MPQQPKVEDEWEDVEWEDIPDEEVTPPIPPTITSARPETEGFLSRAWATATTPLTEAPSRFAESVLGPTPTGGIMEAIGAIPDVTRGMISEPMATMRGFGAGALQGIADLVSQETSPLAIGANLLGVTPPIRRGITGAVRGIGKKIRGVADEVPVTMPSVTGADIIGEQPIDIVSAVRRGEEITAPGPSVRPQFGMRGKTGTTGVAQTPRAPGNRFTFKQTPTKEQIQQLTSKGYVFDGLDDAGKFRFRQVVGKEAALPQLETTIALSKKSEPIIQHINDKVPEQAGLIREAWSFSRGNMSVDLPFITSAGLRQGLPLIGTKNWVKAWIPSIRSYGSKNFSEAHRAMLEADPLMKRPVIPVLKKDGTQLLRDGRPVFKETESIAERAGVVLTNLKSLTSREEAIRSQLAEKTPIWGKVVAASNRSYVAYINDLRLNAFRNMYEAMPDKNNMVALRELGDAVNTFTGRGPLKVKLPFTGGKEASIEKYASGLSEVLFAPKLIASRMQMLNPLNYTMTQPQVRKEYVKAAMRTAGAWMTFAGLAKIAGEEIGGVEVSLNPTSADFGKMKIGNTRLDPAGGFQQFLVLAARLAKGEFTSTTAREGAGYKISELGKAVGPYDPTYGSVIENFIVNKLHPSMKYFYDAAFARKDRPFGVMDRAIQLVIPMLTRDLTEIAQEDPELLPLLAPLTSAGMGTQHYTGQSFNEPFIVPEKYDITLGR